MLRDEFELSAGEAMLNITQMCGLEKFFLKKSTANCTDGKHMALAYGR